ncbi:MAG: methyltransferase domain-containing protein, partial [Pseudomonadota bacterium]
LGDIRFSRYQKRLVELDQPQIKHAVPDWLYQLMQNELGVSCDEILAGLNQPNKVVVRTNISKTHRNQLLSDFQKEDFLAQPLLNSEVGLFFKDRVNVFRSSLFKKGHFEVQDGSSQMVAPFLDIQEGHRVIDACAGAGGKTLHIADRLKNRGKVIALDIHQWKLDQLKLRARRNSYSNIEMRLIEGSKTIKRLKESADRLLLDVPCSGLGVLRRNPDTKWKLTEDSLSELKNLQAEILQNYSAMLKPGGKMVYATCSLLPSENEKQVEKFLKNNSHFSLLKRKTIYPCRDGYDGFFMALLAKK